jgi:hypothetical protein
MPGAGSASPVAWTSEANYLGGPKSTPTYYEVGTNPQVDTAELDNDLLKIVAPDDPEAQRQLAQNLEGQLSVSWILTRDAHHRWLFSDSNTGYTGGQFPSVEWYLGTEAFGITTERRVKGWIPVTYSVEYTQGEPVRVTATGPYGDEASATSFTPSSYSASADEVAFHGASLDVDGATIAKLQSAELEISNIARLIRGTSRHPIDAVQGNVDTQLDHEAVYGSANRLELAYGSSGATAPEDSVGGVPASLSFSAGGTTAATYTLEGATPETYAWSNLANPEEDLTADVTYQCTGVTGSDPTA